jgi:hypothetical protein
VPFGSEPAANVSGDVLFETLMTKLAEALVPFASVAITEKPNAPCVVGVPEISPVDGDRVRPPGNAPELSDQVYGADPPVAESCAAYGVPTVPAPGVPEITTTAAC